VIGIAAVIVLAGGVAVLGMAVLYISCLAAKG
jgi:hypothetical protein